MQVDIDGVSYEGFTTIALAQTYLAADPLYAVAWAALAELQQGRAIIGATRTLSRLDFKEAPDMAAPPEALQDATALLAAAVAAKPKLAVDAGTGNNIKSVKAGPVDVEFFYEDPDSKLPVPENVWAILVAADLLESSDIDEAPVYIAPERDTYFRTEDYYGNGHIRD